MKNKEFIHEESGGRYILLGIAKCHFFKTFSMHDIGDSTGAGTSRDDTVRVYLNINEYVYIPPAPDPSRAKIKLCIYKSATNGKLYHRTVEDFNNRMTEVKEA